MFVFGINLPVAEILFVVLLLFIVALAIIIIQLGRMRKNIRVLDETTLEIRRYEAEEEVTLKPLLVEPAKLSARQRRKVQNALSAAARLERKALAALFKGQEPARVKTALMQGGSDEAVATRAVNGATHFLNQ